MFENRADEWSSSLKTGLICCIYKKGDRNTGYVVYIRRVIGSRCLLVIRSRILARILAKRMRRWAEEMGLLGENQVFWG